MDLARWFDQGHCFHRRVKFIHGFRTPVIIRNECTARGNPGLKWDMNAFPGRRFSEVSNSDSNKHSAPLAAARTLRRFIRHGEQGGRFKRKCDARDPIHERPLR
jgi:hypothetical protein